MAAPHRGNETSYDILDWDSNVNVDERLLDDILRHETQDKDKEAEPLTQVLETPTEP